MSVICFVIYKLHQSVDNVQLITLHMVSGFCKKYCSTVYIVSAEENAFMVKYS